MAELLTLSIDAMGGDSGVEVVVGAVALALKTHTSLRLILVGDESAILLEMHKSGLEISNKLVIHHTTQIVAMDDLPSVAMRNKKDSSMRVAINLVKSGDASACVSAGNTGALMAISRFVLKMIPGIDRPALCTTLPAINGHTHMLDLGANLDCTAEHLEQFAIMGSILASAVDNMSAPRVGLLNIGAEEIKGNEQVKQAGRRLAISKLNYIGFIEGNEIYSEHVDVVVCDGFAGNVALKTSEGVAAMVKFYLTQEFKRTWMNKLAAIVALPVLKAFKQRIDWRQYNGASLLGLKGIVVKSHGNADAPAFANAIEVAMIEATKNIPALIAQQIEPHLRVKIS